MLLKLVSALHGLPRKAFLEGYIRDELLRSGVRYRVEFRGLVTRLVIYGTSTA